MEIESAIERAARAAHEANRVLCAALGDNSQMAWEEAPEWMKESTRKGVIILIENPKVTPEEVHEYWMKHKFSEGWVYGRSKNAELKTHPCLLPYEELPAGQKLKDELFGNVVRAVLNI